MSVRTRLIFAFLLLSVIPLSAVTWYSYASSVGAFRSAVANEADRMTVDLQHRLDTFTVELGRQVSRVWDPGLDPGTGQVADGEALSAGEQAIERLADLLGDSASLLERIELTRLPQPSAPVVPPMPPAGRTSDTATVAPLAVPRPDAPPPPPIVFDFQAVMTEVEKKLAAEGVPPDAAKELRELGEKLGPAVEAGIHMAGAAAKSAVDTMSARARDQAERARERAAADRRAALAGDALAVPIMRDGRLVGSVNARLNLPRTLSMVLGGVQTLPGEIAFAVDTDGKVYTTDPAQARSLEALDVASQRGSGVQQRGDWVVVTREGPSNITLGIARPIAESLKEIRRASIRSLLLGMGVIGLAGLGIVPLSRRMTRNLTVLTEGVERIAQGDLTAQVPVRSRDEFGALATAFNRMARDVAHHQQLVVEREGLQRELELCRRIQSEMLPHASLRLGLTEIKGISIPAREVGGDFFNYFELPQGQIAVLVGDVSGKGISAALLMANIQATLRARLPLEPDLARLTSAIDQEIEAATPAGVYATLFLGILDPALKTLRYVNAGHHPQFLIRAEGIEALSSGGMPVGLYAGQGYVERTVQLADGDLLFFYTDGMVEVENEQSDMFGADRLESMLRAHREEGVSALLERIEESVRRFRGSAEPFDDVTIMALRLGVPQPAA